MPELTITDLVFLSSPNGYAQKQTLDTNESLEAKIEALWNCADLAKHPWKDCCVSYEYNLSGSAVIRLNGPKELTLVENQLSEEARKLLRDLLGMAPTPPELQLPDPPPQNEPSQPETAPIAPPSVQTQASTSTQTTPERIEPASLPTPPKTQANIPLPTSTFEPKSSPRKPFVWPRYLPPYLWDAIQNHLKERKQDEYESDDEVSESDEQTDSSKHVELFSIGSDSETETEEPASPNTRLLALGHNQEGPTIEEID